MNIEVLLHSIENAKVNNIYTQVGLQKAISNLAEYLYFNLHKFKMHWFDEDTRSDFIVWFYPHFETVIRKYDSTRAGFQTYLYYIVQNYYRAFMREKYKKSAREKILTLEEVYKINSTQSSTSELEKNIFAQCKEPTYKSYFKGKKTTAKQKEIFARKIFILACKSSEYLDDDLIDSICEHIQINPEKLLNTIEQIRKKNQNKIERINNIKFKLNEFYIRSLRCKYELKKIDSTSFQFKKLKKEEMLCRKKIIQFRKILKNQYISLSNRELSKITGISRGTIDTTIVKSLNQLYSKSL